MAMFECVTASSLRRLVLIIPLVYFLESGISMLKESAGKFGIPSVSKSHTKRVDCSSFAASFRSSRAWVCRTLAPKVLYMLLYAIARGFVRISF